MKKIKEFFKKFGKYFILVFLLLVGLAAIGVLYLFFVPNSNLFGITYISKNSNHASEAFNADSISKVSLTSSHYDVSVVTTDANSVQVKVLNNSFGFVKKEYNEVVITSELLDETLNLKVQEPTGFALTNNSYIQLILPKNKALDLDLINSTAETTISADGLAIDELKYTTSNGNATLGTATVYGNMNLDLGNATFTIGSNLVLSVPSINDINLKLTTGKLDASSAILGDVNVLSNERGVIRIKECINFNEEVEIAGGSIQIDKLFGAVIKTSDSNVTLGEVTNSVVIKLSKSGSVHITSLSGISDIETNQGEVYIDKVYSDQLVLQTTNGNITVSQAYNHIEALTNHGTIKVTWADDAERHNPTDGKKYRSLSANIDGNGKVVAKNVDYVNVQIKGRGRADLSMSNISGKNIINGDDGSVSISVDKNSKYALKTTSEAGAVQVNLTQVPNFKGYTDKDHELVYVNSEESAYPADKNLDTWSIDENLLQVTTKTGSITILDTNFS